MPIIDPSRRATISTVADLGNALLASSPGDALARALARTFNHNTNAYDRAIDAVYNATHVGGSSLHHIVDGQHSVIGAFQAAHGAVGDASFLADAGGALGHLARDATSVSGIQPFFQLDPDSLRALSDGLASAGVHKSWTADMLTVNAVEILGAGIGAAAAAWPGSDRRRHAALSGSLAASALLSANPLLLGVAGWTAARSAREQGLGRMLPAAAVGGAKSAAIIAVTRLIPWPVLLFAGAGLGVAWYLGRRRRGPVIEVPAWQSVRNLRPRPYYPRPQLESHP